MTTVAASTRTSPRLLPVAELGLLALTLGAVFGFSRVFNDISFAPYLVIVALFAHAAAAITRRRGWRVGTAASVGMAGTFLLLTWMLFPGTTMAGIPTGSTLSTIGGDLSDAWAYFPTAVPPAEPLPGFVLVSCVAVFAAAVLADWAAFRLWSVFEALVPASTLFLFCTLLGAGDGIDSTAVFLACALGFVLVHSAARHESSAGWVGTGAPGAGRGSAATAGLKTGFVLAAMAVLIGVVVGDNLPGAHDDALVNWRGTHEGAGRREALSPLVRIRDRLVEQSNQQVFTVESEEPAYWRLTGLDSFDGEIWKAENQYLEADGDLRTPRPGDAETRPLTQRYSITDLGTLWAPAAFQPTRLGEATEPLNYNVESSTLIPTDDSRNLSNGLSYTVESRLPAFTADQLGTVRATDTPSDIRTKYTRLPRGFPDEIVDRAREVTDNAVGPYRQALALQRFFRDQFTYDAEFPGGHAENVILEFLEQRRGFCEQFAGTFAAMARAIGLPARVAVGFTPGIRLPTSNRFVVKGQQAHAWPEVHLGHYGWVPFEPTPGRGMPGAQAWTNVAPQQDTSTPTAPATTVVPAPGATSTVPTSPSTTNGTTAFDVSPTTLPPPPQPGDPDLAAGAPGVDSGSIWYRLGSIAGKVIGAILRTIGGLLLLLMIVALYTAIVVALKRRKVERRRATAGNPSERARVAWLECLEGLAPLGVAPRPNESYEEFAQRASPFLGDLAPRLDELAHSVEFATYAPDLLDDTSADRAEADAQAIMAGVQGRASWYDQWYALADARPLLAQRAPRDHHRTVSR